MHWNINVPVPAELSVSGWVRGEVGSSGVLEFPICRSDPPTAEAWRALLTSRGFLAQAGTWDVSGVLYGLRFRKGKVYGDLAVWQSARGSACQRARLRVYVGSEAPHFSDRYVFSPSVVCSLIDVDEPQVGCLPFFTDEKEWRDVERLYSPE